MRCFVTGAAGFIGSTLTDRLLAQGHAVTGYDNLSTGFRDFLAGAATHDAFRLIEGDVLDQPRLTAAMAGADTVFHLAANADVRFGLEHPRRDLEQNTVATLNVLEAMLATGAKRIVFASTGSIYGEAKMVPTPEEAPFPIQTSLYGASKLAGEGLICAFAEGFGLQATIFRFVSILGPRYTHGHVFDFYRQLLETPDALKVQGDGRQTKSYLHIQDCIDGILQATSGSDEKVRIFNLGHRDSVTVTNSIGYIVDQLGLSPTIHYAGGRQGWVGDNPLIHLDATKIERLGWRPKFSIEEAVRDTLRWLSQNRWVYEQRR